MTSIDNGYESLPRSFSIYRSFYCYIPLRYSIQLCTVSGGCVSLICRNASSSKTSPVAVSSSNTTFRLANVRRRAPVFSSSIRPRKPNSVKIQPRKPDEIQSFQNDV